MKITKTHNLSAVIPFVKIFFDLESGEIGLGDGQCNYHETCLFVTHRGLFANAGDPVMLKSGEEIDNLVLHGDVMYSWDPFGTKSWGLSDIFFQREQDITK